MTALDTSDALLCIYASLVLEQGGFSGGTGRARFVEFLNVLCDCNNEPVRNNQWRVCRLFCQEAAELLFKLRLVDGKLLISANPAFFPAFVSDTEMELSHWLTHTQPTTASYFSAVMALLAELVRGRNLRNAPIIQALLPYELVEAAITSPQLNKGHLGIVAKFVQVTATSEARLIRSPRHRNQFISSLPWIFPHRNHRLNSCPSPHWNPRCHLLVGNCLRHNTTTLLNGSPPTQSFCAMLNADRYRRLH